jgi:hypothetical protein
MARPVSEAVAAAAPPGSDAAIKARIITHMNADHAYSLELYVRHYNQLPIAQARAAKLHEITQTHLILTTTQSRLLIPLSPPLDSSLKDARERLVEMHNTCLAALGIAAQGVIVEAYVPPNALYQVFTLVSVASVLFTLPFRAALHPDSGSWLSWYWSLGGMVPGVARLAYAVAPLVWWLTLAIHVGETVWFVRTRLGRFSVVPFTGVWWCWVVDCFFEGFGAFRRFDALVGELERTKGKGRH